MPSVEKISYGGWPNCYRIGNGVVDLMVVTDVGPRVIRFGFLGRENEFGEFPDELGKTGGNKRRNYGGHRLWHAPEDPRRTYYPDNFPTQAEVLPQGLKVTAPVETTTGIQKEIEVRLAGQGTHVHVTHRLRNAGLWAVELAPWALSVMATGGAAVVPLPPRLPHPQNLLPTSSFVLWPYTDLTDPRWRFGSRHIFLRQDPQAAGPQKSGLVVPDGWAAYLRGDHLFLKKFRYVPGAAYADFGSSVEVFTNAKILELETLGPLARLEPGAAVEYDEHWFLYDGVRLDNLDDDSADRAILPKVKESDTGS